MSARAAIEALNRQLSSLTRRDLSQLGILTPRHWVILPSTKSVLDCPPSTPQHPKPPA